MKLSVRWLAGYTLYLSKMPSSYGGDVPAQIEGFWLMIPV